METFSAEWLALREPADHAARAGALEQAALRAARATAEATVLRVVDLGAGAGSNLRHLARAWRDAAVVPARQDWHLVDHDAALLRAAIERTRDWAPGAGYVATSEAGGLDLQGRGHGLTVRTHRADLTRLETVPFESTSPVLVTGAALLDLTSAPWLAALAARCRQARATVLFALTYDGAIECDPRDPLDDAVRDLVNHHQRGDKGFGPAEGPGGTRAASRAFAAEGYTVERARSDWHLQPEETALQRELILGWVTAATELAPTLGPDLDGWRDRRLAHVGAGVSRLRVGHEDLLACL